VVAKGLAKGEVEMRENPGFLLGGNAHVLGAVDVVFISDFQIWKKMKKGKEF